VIVNETELRMAYRDLRILERSVQALRNQLKEQNPDLLAVTENTYVLRIESLQREIADYLYAHPAEVSRLQPSVPDPAQREPVTIG
jgi:hypothetical protein